MTYNSVRVTELTNLALGIHYSSNCSIILVSKSKITYLLLKAITSMYI